MANDFWFKFKFKDYINDTRPLSLTARGLLMEIIIYMESNKTYWLPNDIRLLIRLTGGTTEEITDGLSEIFRFASLNFEKNERGEEILVSRKIFKDLEKSRINAANGKKGGNPVLKNESQLSPGLTETDNHSSNRNSYSYSNKEDSREKGGVGEKEKEETFAPQPHKIDREKKYFDDSITDALWLEKLAVALRITAGRSHELVTAFHHECQATGEPHADLQKWRKHATSWIRIQLEKPVPKTRPQASKIENQVSSSQAALDVLNQQQS